LKDLYLVSSVAEAEQDVILDVIHSQNFISESVSGIVVLGCVSNGSIISPPIERASADGTFEGGREPSPEFLPRPAGGKFELWASGLGFEGCSSSNSQLSQFTKCLAQLPQIGLFSSH